MCVFPNDVATGSGAVVVHGRVAVGVLNTTHSDRTSNIPAGLKISVLAADENP